MASCWNGFHCAEWEWVACTWNGFHSPGEDRAKQNKQTWKQTNKRKPPKPHRPHRTIKAKDLVFQVTERFISERLSWCITDFHSVADILPSCFACVSCHPSLQTLHVTHFSETARLRLVFQKQAGVISNNINGEVKRMDEEENDPQCVLIQADVIILN